MAERTFKFKFTGDADDLGKATGDAEGHMSGLGGKLSGAAKGIVGAMAAAFAVDKIVGWGQALFDIGNQADVWGKKADIVFGDQIGMMEEWAAANAGAMGMTQTELLGTSAAMADLLIPMGMTREQAAVMTQEMSGVSGALSAWSGGTRTATEVNEILAAALLGETDSLKGLGISIDAAEVGARALAIATAEGRTEVTQMDEALATQQLIMEKSTDAQTAWANGTFDAQKKQAELTAKIKEAKEQLATALLPAFQKVTAWLVDSAIPAFQNFKEWVWPKIQSAFQSLAGWWETNGPAIRAFLDEVKAAAIRMGEGFMSAWRQHIQPAVVQLKGSWADLKRAMGELSAAVGFDSGKMGGVFRVLGTVVGGVVLSMVASVTFLSNRITDIVNSITMVINGVKAAWQRMKDLFQGKINIPTPNWPKPPSWMKGFIPDFHSGTISVPGAPGANVPAVLQAGETVLSRGQTRATARAGGGGMSIIVNAYGATGREMIAEIERAVRDGARSAWLATAGVAP